MRQKEYLTAVTLFGGLQAGMAIGMQTPGMQFLGQPQFMGMRPAGPQYTADLQKQMAEEHQ